MAVWAHMGGTFARLLIHETLHPCSHLLVALIEQLFGLLQFPLLHVQLCHDRVEADGRRGVVLDLMAEKIGAGAGKRGSTSWALP